MAGEQKLVKARPKSREYLPEWAKCCEERILSILASGELTLDISHTCGEDGLTCVFCGSPVSSGPVARDIADDTWVHIEEYDLDEGICDGR